MFIIDVTRGDTVNSRVIGARDVAEDVARQISCEGATVYVYMATGKGNGRYKVRYALSCYEGGKRRGFSVLEKLGKDAQGVTYSDLELYHSLD